MGSELGRVRWGVGVSREGGEVESDADSSIL